MKIKKIQNTYNLQNRDPNDMCTTFSTDVDFSPTITVEKLLENIIYVSDSEGNTHTITLDSKDILKLMTWLVGQEKHVQEELTSLRNKVEAQKIQSIASFDRLILKISKPDEAYSVDFVMPRKNPNELDLKCTRKIHYLDEFQHVILHKKDFTPFDITDNVLSMKSKGSSINIETDKIKENQKIVNGLLDSLQTAQSFENPVERKAAESYEDYLDLLRKELKRITGKDIKDL